MDCATCKKPKPAYAKCSKCGAITCKECFELNVLNSCFKCQALYTVKPINE